MFATLGGYIVFWSYSDKWYQRTCRVGARWLAFSIHWISLLRNQGRIKYPLAPRLCLFQGPFPLPLAASTLHYFHSQPAPTSVAFNFNSTRQRQSLKNALCVYDCNKEGLGKGRGLLWHNVDTLPLHNLYTLLITFVSCNMDNLRRKKDPIN